MSKLSKFNIMFGIFAIIFLSVILYHFYILKFGPEVNTGETWVCVYNEDNPFEKNVHDTMKILDVRDGYVLYENSHNDTFNVKKKYFIIYEKLK